MDKIENIQVAPGKILVTPWSDAALEEKMKSLDKILVTDDQKKQAMQDAVKDKIGSVLLMKATIVNVGPGLSPEMDYKVGDSVYVFGNTFDSDFKLNGVYYLIFSERNIQAKVKVDPNGNTNEAEPEAKPSSIILDKN